MTLRDEAWTTALEQIVKTGKFKLSDLPFKNSERHTVRRVLRELESFGWLERTSPHSSIWRPGPRAVFLLNLEDEKIEIARN